MAVSVRYHKADRFERLRLVRAAMPVTPFGFVPTGMRFSSWDRAVLPAAQVDAALSAQSALS